MNFRRCPTLVQSCTASEASQNKLDLGIQKGYNWIMGYIIKHYETLNDRVEKDVNEQQIKDQEELLEKIKRIKEQHALEESKQKDDMIETYSEYVKKMNGEAKAVEPLDARRKSETAFEDSSSMGSASLSESSESFPPVYIMDNEFNHIDRPKSSVELVKNQLKMRDNVQKPPPRHRMNKTVPINLYGARYPYSADERRRQVIVDRSQQLTYDRRHLRSADNALFTISNHVVDNVMGPSGDYIGLKIFENGNLKKSVHRQTSGGDVMSVIDI